MKFYGNGIVWDAQAGRTLCRFINGEFESTDEHTESVLKGLGYKYDPPKEIRVIETGSSDGYKTYAVADPIKDVDIPTAVIPKVEAPKEAPKPKAKPRSHKKGAKK